MEMQELKTECLKKVEKVNELKKKLSQKIILRDLNNLNKQIEAIQKNADNMKKNIDRIPDYSKQIKQLLDIYEPKRELLFALIDRIEIDENRMIYIKFKYDIIDTVIFKYEEITTPRNPNGRKGKKQKEM